MEYDQNKLLSVASRSFNGYYSGWFKEKSKNKDEHIEFKLSDDETLKSYETQITDCGNNIFTIPSFSSDEAYLVDMTLGICECNIGKCGASWKHQYLLWSTRHANCPNFIPTFNPAECNKFA